MQVLKAVVRCRPLQGIARVAVITINPLALTSQCSNKPTRTFPGCPLVVTALPNDIPILRSCPAAKTASLSRDQLDRTSSTQATNHQLRSSLAAVNPGTVLLRWETVASTEWAHHRHQRTCKATRAHTVVLQAVEEANNSGGMRTDLPQCHQTALPQTLTVQGSQCHQTGHHLAMVPVTMGEVHCTISSAAIRGTQGSNITKR